MFNIIGAAAAAANLLCEFKIPEKKDDKLTNNKKGNVILVRLIAVSNFSEFSVKPGAINFTNNGINISIIKTIKNKLKISKLNILVANFSDWSLVVSNNPWGYTKPLMVKITNFYQ